MAEKQSAPDPAAAFRDLVAQWEKGINELANRTMNSDEFSRAINKATTASTTMQQQLGELIGRYLASLNLPSRSEMVNIGERLQAIETSLHRISAQLDRASAANANTPGAGPPRTKRPPAPEQKGGAA